MASAARIGTVKKSRAQLEPESGILSISVAFFTTLISFAIANIVFDQVAACITRWRRVQTEFAFSPPSHHTLLMVFLIFGGAIAIRFRRWIVPVG